MGCVVLRGAEGVGFAPYSKYDFWLLIMLRLPIKSDTFAVYWARWPIELPVTPLNEMLCCRGYWPELLLRF